MDYKIQNTYEVTKTNEFSVDWNGFNFLIIYGRHINGRHINGWFIAIPNWNICTEAGEPTSVDYNATKIAQTHIHDIALSYLARAICEHWEEMKKCTKI